MLAQSEQEVVRFWVNPENRGLGGNVKERKKKGWHNDFRQAKRKAGVIIYEMEHGTGLKGKVIVQLWCLGFHCLLDTQAEVLTGKSAELKSIIHV